MSESHRYERLRLLGSGTFGQAWLCRQAASTDETGTCVVKEVNAATLNEKQRQQALTEVTALSRCNHDNVIRYIDAYVTGTTLNIVMDYADQGDLHDQIIAREGRYFTQEVVFDWLIQISLALRHIHSVNILHRDLKTKNIFLSRGGIVKVGDFGISRVLTDSVQKADTVVGTPYYLSPEICQHQPYNNKSDMWALGCVLYELLCLTHPFQGANLGALILTILKASYNPLPRHYGPLPRTLVSSLLCVEPNDRPSADELLALPALQPYIIIYAKRSQRHVHLPSRLESSPLRCPPPSTAESKKTDDAFRRPSHPREHATCNKPRTNVEFGEPERKQPKIDREIGPGHVKSVDDRDRVKKSQRRRSTPRPIPPTIKSAEEFRAPVCNVLMSIGAHEDGIQPGDPNIVPMEPSVELVKGDAQIPAEVMCPSTPDDRNDVGLTTEVHIYDQHEQSAVPPPAISTPHGEMVKKRIGLVERDRNIRTIPNEKDTEKTPTETTSSVKKAIQTKDICWSEGKENTRVKHPGSAICIRNASLSSPKMEAIIEHHKRKIRSAESVFVPRKKAKAVLSIARDTSQLNEDYFSTIRLLIHVIKARIDGRERSQSPKLALFREVMLKQQSKAELPSSKRLSDLHHRRLKNDGRTYTLCKEVREAQHQIVETTKTDDVTTLCSESPTDSRTSPHSSADVLSPLEGASTEDEIIPESPDDTMTRLFHKTMYINRKTLPGRRKVLQTHLDNTIGPTRVRKNKQFVEYCIDNVISYDSMRRVLDADIVESLPLLFQMIQLDTIQKT